MTGWIRLKLKELLFNNNGSIMIMAGIMIPTIVLISMLTIDTSLIFRTKDKMQTSLDAAILAVAAELKNFPSDLTPKERQTAMEQVFSKFYSSNFSQLAPDKKLFTLDSGDFNVVYNEDANLFTAEVTYDYDGLGEKLLSSQSKDLFVSGSTTIDLEFENFILDIVMCIDATTSMGATLEAVKAQALTFNQDLRAQFDASSENVKIRVRPIFYRDYLDQFFFENPQILENPRYIRFKNFYDAFGLDEGIEFYPVGDGFIDLDPSEQSGLEAVDQSANFLNFTNTIRLSGGGTDFPESAGGCLNEGIRSNWFDNQSTEARDYFNIPQGNNIIKTYEDDMPGVQNVKVTTIPVVVFWTDAGINSLDFTSQLISPTLPTSYAALENNVWNNDQIIDQRVKLLIHFNQVNDFGQGWSNIRLWDRYSFGGNLMMGNTNGVQLIADEIKRSIPEILRVSS